MRTPNYFHVFELSGHDFKIETWFNLIATLALTELVKVSSTHCLYLFETPDGDKKLNYKQQKKKESVAGLLYVAINAITFSVSWKP